MKGGNIRKHSCPLQPGSIFQPNRQNLLQTWEARPRLSFGPVSYTHLDVYKRQGEDSIYPELTGLFLIELKMCIRDRCTGKGFSEIEAHFEGRGYADFKKELADVIIQALAPVQERYRQYDDSGELPRILKQGAEKANQVSSQAVSYTHLIEEGVSNLLKMAPDVLVLDMLLSHNVLEQALVLAEAGAQVFLGVQSTGTVHGLEALTRAVNYDYRQDFRNRLSRVFESAVYLELVQGVTGIVPATEVLVGIEPVRNLLRDGKFSHISETIPTGGKYGICLLYTSRRLCTWKTFMICPLSGYMTTQSKL